jgi:hypothetical protein
LKGNDLRINAPPAVRSGQHGEEHNLWNGHRQPMNALALTAHDL